MLLDHKAQQATSGRWCFCWPRHSFRKRSLLSFADDDGSDFCTFWPLGSDSPRLLGGTHLVIMVAIRRLSALGFVVAFAPTNMKTATHIIKCKHFGLKRAGIDQIYFRCRCFVSIVQLAQSDFWATHRLSVSMCSSSVFPVVNSNSNE